MWRIAGVAVADALNFNHAALLAPVNGMLAPPDVNWISCPAAGAPKAAVSCGDAGWLNSVGGGSTVSEMGI